MIKLNKITKEIKGKTVLDNISIEFIEGNSYLLKEHNGSGKTMLLRLLCDLIKPTTGKVVREIKEYTYGIIIENPSFLENETALYNLKYLASIKKRITEQEIYDALKLLNLYDHRNDKVKTFSLGMKQRLGLCQAIMEDPDVLLLDEPFNALDDENYEVVKNILKHLKEKGKLIIIAAHGLSKEDFHLFDEIITLSAGKVQDISLNE
ncbi:hypothetical protein BKP37_09170 [Anaerobacillus alkalilacustris]|uniref:ABC transporter domain-containing protein n=1 Tax=Anaerobacillus alkalilacustris TaxID=393763 RepID=A0A1S2LN70_9BACI|nr:ABC transporter ATP-binding protein [Anaerobacillus alkalilacustris]OIJ13978.1 hypothetical protein BKP37_09170 [Anaerobacillus alkalilacustris]